MGERVLRIAREEIMNSESRTRLSLVPIIKQTRPLEADAVTEVETEEKVKEWNINMTQYITTILSALLDTDRHGEESEENQGANEMGGFYIVSTLVMLLLIIVAVTGNKAPKKYYIFSMFRLDELFECSENAT